ncbi:hypothetical protein J4402_01215 [Candidatus Pacearchaeota archaeon]|nr:hypothetical protein [Candidatus Pacearchaeota archaeon]
MQNKTYILLILSFLILIGSAIAFLIITEPEILPSSPSETIEECQNLAYSSPNAINLVFFSEKADAQKYSDYIAGIKPFDKNPLNIYYIPTYIPKCELYKEIAVLCYSKELIKKASSCPNDYLIVLKEEPSSIRSSAYMNVLSINTRHPKSVFPHEIAHALANLAEEYTPANLPSGQKNCVSSCNKFETEINACELGCSKDSYYRSIDRGIMRTLSSNEYGIYDENLIQERIISQVSSSPITGNAIYENCLDKNYYLIEAVYISQQNEIQVQSQTIELGCVGSNGYGNFNYTLYDNNGMPLDSKSFNAELIFTDAPGEIEIEGEIYENDGPFILKISAIPDVKKLEISHKEKITEINMRGIGARPCRI